MNKPKPKVLVAETIAQEGIENLTQFCEVEVADNWTEQYLKEQLARFDAIIIRSATKLTAELIEAGANLSVIGRAGVGVDNVDLDAASNKGIVVVNAPESNVLSVAEHVFGLLLALARNIAIGDASLRSGKWQRSTLKGVELSGRTIVLLGMGRIGQLVAARARVFGMRVVGYDPFLPAERFARMDVERAETLEDALAQADVISLHMPLTLETRNLINDETLSMLKPGALLVNTARGGLCDLDALERALQSGVLKGAALDVFPQEPPPSHPLFERSDIVITPHLAASTKEAQQRAGVQVAQQVVAALCGGVVTSAVNIPAISLDELEALQPWVPLAAKLARLADQIVQGPAQALHVSSIGEIASFNNRMLVTGSIVGLLAGVTDTSVNAVNAENVAAQRGLDVSHSCDDSTTTYHSKLEVKVSGSDRIAKAAGTLIGGSSADNRPWLTSLVGFDLDIELVRHMAFFRYDDIPGVIGRVGTAFGDAGINIANMSVARCDGRALMAVSFDEKPAQNAIDQIASSIECDIAQAVDLG